MQSSWGVCDVSNGQSVVSWLKLLNFLFCLFSFLSDYLGSSIIHMIADCTVGNVVYGGRKAPCGLQPPAASAPKICQARKNHLEASVCVYLGFRVKTLNS